MTKNRKDETSETTGETVRKSGLAYGAALTLFAAVVIFLAIGYAVDLYFKSSPWGLVGGIILGSLIGLYQFIRITNKIN